MKKFTYLLLLVVIFTACKSAVEKSPEEKCKEAFNLKVKEADTLFSKSPIFLSTQKFPDSKSGEINYLLKVENIKAVSYDLEKTNSLTSPFIGYIIVKIKISSNAEFGNVKGYAETAGFETADEAKKVNTFASCTKDSKDTSYSWCVGDIKINYAYQEGSWVFKGVDGEIINKISDGVTRGDIEQRGLLNNYLTSISK